jgi:hypothetical protein
MVSVPLLLPSEPTTKTRLRFAYLERDHDADLYQGQLYASVRGGSRQLS